MLGAEALAQVGLLLPNSRQSESEADKVGMEIAAKAGYDPRAAATLWQKMEKEGGGGPPQFLSTHPSPGNRQQTLAALAPTMMAVLRGARRAAGVPARDDPAREAGGPEGSRAVRCNNGACAKSVAA